MKTPTNGNQIKSGMVHETLSQFKEEVEMKAETILGMVNRRLKGSIANTTAAKVVGGVALGVILTAAVAAPIGLTFLPDDDAPSNSFVSSPDYTIDRTHFDQGLVAYGLVKEDAASNSFVSSPDYTIDRTHFDQGLVAYGLVKEDAVNAYEPEYWEFPIMDPVHGPGLDEGGAGLRSTSAIERSTN